MMRPRSQPHARSPQAIDYNENYETYDDLDEPPHRRPSPAEISSILSARSSAMAEARSSIVADETMNGNDLGYGLPVTTPRVEGATTLSLDLGLDASLTVVLPGAETTTEGAGKEEEEDTTPWAMPTRTYGFSGPAATGEGTLPANAYSTAATESVVEATSSTLATATSYAARGTRYSELHSPPTLTATNSNRLVDATAFPDATRAQRDGNGLSTGSLVSAVVIPILAVLVVLLLGLLCFRRKRRRRDIPEATFNNPQEMAETTAGAGGVSPDTVATAAGTAPAAGAAFLPALREKFFPFPHHSHPRNNHTSNGTFKPPAQTRARNHIGPAALAYNHPSNPRHSNPLQQIPQEQPPPFTPTPATQNPTTAPRSPATTTGAPHMLAPPPPMMSPTRSNAGYYTGLPLISSTTNSSNASRNSQTSRNSHNSRHSRATAGLASLNTNYSGDSGTARRSEGGTTFAEAPPVYPGRTTTGRESLYTLPAADFGEGGFDPFGDRFATTNHSEDAVEGQRAAGPFADPGSEPPSPPPPPFDAVSRSPALPAGRHRGLSQQQASSHQAPAPAYDSLLPNCTAPTPTAADPDAHPSYSSHARSDVPSRMDTQRSAVSATSSLESYGYGEEEAVVQEARVGRPVSLSAGTDLGGFGGDGFVNPFVDGADGGMGR
ncbi:hypothetical protein MBLNU230_g5552t1 [Neophaeotheca triangularis]